MVFDGHPTDARSSERPTSSSALNRDTLLAFYRRHYVPESFTLVVVGPVDRARDAQGSRADPGRLPRSGFQRLPGAVPAPHAEEESRCARPGALAYLGMGWLGPKLDHADTPAVDLLVSILGQSRSVAPAAVAPRAAGHRQFAIGSDYAALEAGGVITVTAQLESGERRARRDRDPEPDPAHARPGR